MNNRVTLSVTVLLAMGLLLSESSGQFASGSIRQQTNAVPDARYHTEDGKVRAVYGTTLSTGANPVESAQKYLDRWQGLYGEDLGELVPVANEKGQVAIPLMHDTEDGSPRFHTFRLQQTFGGLPLFRKGIGFLVRNEPGHPLVLSGFDLTELKDVELDIPTFAAHYTPAIEASVLSQLHNEDPNSPLHQFPLMITDEEFVIWAGSEEAPAEPRVSLLFTATRGSVQTVPFYEKFRFIADIDTAQIVLAETMVHNAAFTDISGNVQGNSTQGIGADECGAETAESLPYGEVLVVGGNTVFADASGNFTIPHGGTTQVTVRSRLRGQFFEVYDQAAGAFIPQLDISVTPPGPANFLHNQPVIEGSTANVNAYLHANVIRDWVLSFEPSFPVIDTQTFFDVNTNIGSTCNAFYDGASINFYSSGGGCNNTAFSDVVYHEYGHHLINVTGNGQGQMGEGSGDVVGVLLQDEPSLGNGFFQGDCGNGIRNANNSHQYPCNGAIHDCGQLISGCVWDTRNELIVTEPASYQDIGSALFLGMLIARGQQTPGDSTISPFITVLYITLDDDDANIGNGSPHYPEIATGFGAHNMDAPPLSLVQFDYPSGRPDSIDPAGGVAFTVAASSLTEDPQTGTGMLHVDRGSGFEMFAMNETASNVYEASFPTTPCGSEVLYYVSVDTLQGSTANDPSTAPSSSYSALSAVSASTVFEDDFETNMGWSVSSTASDGQWNRGVPAGGGVRGDPPTDGDGSGQCYLTDNVSGNSDVDDGSTTLTSPVMDASGPGEQVLSYYRWFSNHFGNAPFEDTMVVEISNNGGSSWSTLEVVGPTGPEVSGGWFQKSFRIADHVTPTSNMRVRFVASDLINGSVVEAAVDGVKIEEIDCSGCTNPPSMTDLGNALAGTHGNPVLTGTGCLEIGETLTLEITNALENTGFAYIIGVSALNAPFFGGILVPAPDLFLLGLSTDSAGEHTLAAILPATLPSGIDLYLQAWIIDGAGPRGFAATNGITGMTQ